jgi:hypothetical protein
MSGGREGTGALAWHPDLELSKPELDEFLSGRWVVRLATTSPSGYPHIAPLWYYWDGVCLYVSLTRRRASCRNLERDPRCAAVIDMDERPLIGLAANLAIAVQITGDAELLPVEPGRTIRFDGGPFAGEHSAAEAIGMMSRRYGLWDHDGALGRTIDRLRELTAPGGEDRAAQDNEGRVVVRIRPRRIRSWDFSRAPIGRLEVE